MSTESPTPNPAPTPSKSTRSIQNQVISAYITDSLKTLNTALETPEILEKLIPAATPPPRFSKASRSKLPR